MQVIALPFLHSLFQLLWFHIRVAWVISELLLEAKTQLDLALDRQCSIKSVVLRFSLALKLVAILKSLNFEKCRRAPRVTNPRQDDNLHELIFGPVVFPELFESHLAT